MMDWLVKLAEAQKSEDQVLREKVETLPEPMLNDLVWQADPSSRPTNLEDMMAKIANAERLGRELAREMTEKDAGVLNTVMGGIKGFATGGPGGALMGAAKEGVKDAVVGGVSKAVSNAVRPPAAAGGAMAPAVGGFSYGKSASLNLGGMGQKAMGFFHRNPGAAITLAGAGIGAMMAPRDPQTGQKHYLQGALAGGGLAAGANALTQGRMGDKLRQYVTRQNNPIFGQGVRRSVIESAYKTRPGAAGAVSAGAAAAPAAQVTGGAAPMGSSPAWQAAHRGVEEMKNDAHGAANMFAGWKPGYSGGPTMGTPKVAFLLGGLAGHMAAGKDREASPRSGFWRGAGGGLLGGMAGSALGGALTRGHGAGVIGGALAGELGGGILAGRTARPTHTEIKAHHAGELARHKAILESQKSHKEKKANRQTLTYDPATKTFVRQHLTPDTSVGNVGNDVIPAGHTEPVMSGAAGRGQYAGQVAPAGAAPSGGMGQTHVLHGGSVLSSTPNRGVASMPAGAMTKTPPPLPLAARNAVAPGTPQAAAMHAAGQRPAPAAAHMGGPGGLAAAAAKPKLPNLAGAVSLVKR